MSNILWSDTIMSQGGKEFTLEVTADWMAGHGAYVDEMGNPNRFRWAIYIEAQGRPRAAYRYGVGNLDLAIQEGTDKLRSYR